MTFLVISQSIQKSSLIDSKFKLDERIPSILQSYALHSSSVGLHLGAEKMTQQPSYRQGTALSGCFLSESLSLQSLVSSLNHNLLTLMSSPLWERNQRHSLNIPFLTSLLAWNRICCSDRMKAHMEGVQLKGHGLVQCLPGPQLYRKAGRVIKLIVF